MGVSHRHLNCTVAHPLSDSPNVGSSHDQPGRERVSVAVPCVILQPRFLYGWLKPVPRIVAVDDQC